MCEMQMNSCGQKRLAKLQEDIRARMKEKNLTGEVLQPVT